MDTRDTKHRARLIDRAVATAASLQSLANELQTPAERQQPMELDRVLVKDYVRRATASNRVFPADEALLVDIAVDQGGCAETTRPTLHHDPTDAKKGVIHYCVANMPGACARTATQALVNVTHPYIEWLADLGLEGACKRQPALVGGINVMGGAITCESVVTADGLPFSPVQF